MNKNINLRPAALGLAEDLLADLKTANALDGYFAQEAGGAYGAIKDALIVTIACAIADRSIEGNHIFFGDARDIARLLYDQAIYNGENIAWQVELWNNNIISL